MIKLNKVSLRRGARLLLSDVDLAAYPGEKWGITGANGIGKSSLFALITGDIDADAGEVHVPAKLNVSQVRQEVPVSDAAAIDYVIDGDHELRDIEAQLKEAEVAADGVAIASAHEKLHAVDGFTARARAGRLLHGLGFGVTEHDKSVNTFSGGWRMRLNLAQALMQRSDLLLLDEPTNHLDLDALVWLERWLLSYQGILLLITHDREFLDRVANHIAHLENQKVTTSTGNYSDAEDRRAEQLLVQQQQYDRQQRDIAHMQKFVERFRYKASKARQAQSRLKALEKMEKVAAVHASAEFAFSFEQPEAIPDPMLKLEDVSAGYGDTVILNSVDFSLAAGSRIGLLGANGAGKSTMMKTLARDLSPVNGEYVTSSTLNIGYFAQHQIEQLDLQGTALEHMRRLAASEGTRDTEARLRSFLGRFGYSGDMASETVGIRSGGEKARLVLAMLVYQRPNLLLLDEPTNHLDIYMRQAITNALQDFEGSLVIVAHDRYLLRLVTDELWLVDSGKVSPFAGDLDDYVRWLNDRQRNTEPKDDKINAEDSNGQPSTGVVNAAGAASKASTARSAKEQRKHRAAEREQTKPLRDKIKRLERDMEKITGLNEVVTAKLADADLYSDANKVKLKNLLADQGDYQKQLTELEEQWLTLSEQLDTQTRA